MTEGENVMTERVVVVGGGVGGGTTALALRAAGFTGTITVVCADPHPPYSKPPLSKAVLRGERGPERSYLRPAKLWERQDVVLRVGQPATAVDGERREVELANGERLPYDALVLAPGSIPRRLPGAQPSERVLYLQTIEDAQRISQRLSGGGRLLVVGAGFVGAEVAASARAMGCEVTVLEAAPAPLSRLLPPVVGAWYAAMHRDRGVDLRLGCAVQAVEEHADGVTVTDAAGERYPVDAVLIAVGSVPDTSLAVAAGAAVGDGVLVDEYCRTTVPGIFAVGDVANFPNARMGGARMRVEHWQNAQHQAQAVGRTIAGVETPFAEVPWVWSEQYEVNLQITGLPEASDEVVWRGDPDAGAATAFLLRAGRLVAAVGLNSADDIQLARELIGHGVTPDRDVLRDVDGELVAASV